MKKLQFTALILCITMIMSLSPYRTVGALADENADKGERRVYLHAFNDAPSDNTSEIRHTVYMGEDVNVYLAVDNPNKGEYLAADHEDVVAIGEAARAKATEEAEKNPNFTTDEAKQKYIDYETAKAVQLARHTQPQYDMQGYTVKIYFDTKYFRLKDDANPLDFKVPNKTNGFEIVDGEEIKVDTSLNPGYMTHKPHHKCDKNDREGYASATVFLMGNGFFPEKTGDVWYNLCRLPLIPLQTGATSVRLEYDTGTSDDLELYAKNVEDEKLNFDTDVLNDGVFYLNIEEAGRPSKPIATRAGGTYTEKTDVKLYHTNNDECEIWYSTNGADPRNNTQSGVMLYDGGNDVSENEVLTFETNTVLKARVYRPSDGKWSDLSTFTYEFLPHSPYLFDSEKNEIPVIYSQKTSGYYVYVCDRKNFSEGITPGNTVYYTFSPNLSPDYILKGSSEYVSSTPAGNPETQWVPVSNLTQKIEQIIDRSRLVRLVTVNTRGHSDISVYHLGIKPAPVAATPGSGLDTLQPVTLKCDTPGAKIFYTTNGDDPRKETRTEYTEPLYFDEDTVVKAVSFYDGQWSDVSSFWYIFSEKTKSGVSAVYPSGIYTGNVEVILYPDNPGEKIEVSFDGGKTWNDYDGTIIGDTTTITEHIEFNARIKNPDNTPDYLGDKFVYIIKPLAPVFSPESCEFTSADSVSVFSPESTNENKDRFELWYTLDGSMPDGRNKAPDDDIIAIPITGYTKIMAVVVKDGEYMSEVVESTYNVVYDKPAKPMASLPSGYYTHEIGSDGYNVKFITPPEGVTIYYTIGTRDNPFDDPDVNGGEGTIKYEPGSEIFINHDTVIKAVAVDTSGGIYKKSDVAVFDYDITPEAPSAPESTAVAELPLIPVDALAIETSDGRKCHVEYKIGNETEGYAEGIVYADEENSDGHIRFYIDAKTGNAYKDANKTELLYDAKRDKNFENSVILEIKTELDGAQSETNAYAYIIGGDEVHLTPPYADKESGTYIESKTMFEVYFHSIYDGMDNVSIEWKYDGDEQWTPYNQNTPPSFETKDTIIYARTVDKSDNASSSVGYIYTFNPPPPSIVPETGIYFGNEGKKAYVYHAADVAYDSKYYYTYYKLSDDTRWSESHAPAEIYPYDINKSMTVMAYTYNEATGRFSRTVSERYTVNEKSSSNTVGIKYPFSKKRISAHELGKGIYAEGIRFTEDENVLYEYAYTLIGDNSNTYKSEVIAYDPDFAFVPTERIDCMTINVWINGDKDNTLYTHSIDFVHLGVPETDLPEQTEYEANTPYHIVNEYKNDPSVIVYYTTDNSDPTNPASDRKSFTLSEHGNEEMLTGTTTVKTVYFSACKEATCIACGKGDYARCDDYVYGKPGEYKYPVPTKTTVISGGGGGGGGGRVNAKERKYTKDIFGNEHPTHIGYINGYPDGSVKPEGDITREEITSILYRITNHEYEKPFAATGEVFPDVEVTRWSAHDIEYMADGKVVYGYPDGEFKPSRNLTRAEFAALIFRFAEIEKTDTENPFNDLDKSHWAYDEIIALAESGLVEGYEDRNFRPENNITRAEVMTVINKLLGRKPLESYVKSLGFNPFNDLYADKWYYVTVLEATITHNYWLDSVGYEYKWEDWK